MQYKFKPLIVVCAIFVALSFSGCGGKTAEEHLLAADQFIAADNPQAAVLELKNAIQLDQKSASARFKLGLLYLEQERFESAEKELNRALELGYSAAEVMPLISVAYKETGASNALVELSHTDSSLSASENAKIGFYKLVAFVDLGQTDEAHALIRELQLLDTQSVYKGLVKSYTSILEEDYESALEQVKLLKEQSPLNEDVLRLLSRLHLILGEKEQATKLLGQLYSLRPNNIELKFSYTAALIDLKRFDEAEPLVDSLLPIDTNNGILNQFKGTILAEKQDFGAALGYLQKAILNGRDTPVTRLLAGFSAHQIGDFEEANNQLSLIASSLPSGHPALRLLADSQLKLGQSQEASDTLLGLTDISNTDASLFSQAGYQLLKQGNVEKAKQIVAEGEKIGTTPQELVRLGVLQLSLNDVAGILKLEEAVEQAPELTITQHTLAAAYLLAGETEKAAALTKSWKEQQPDAYEPYILEGELAQSRGEFGDAKALYEKALELATDKSSPQLALTNLLIAQGKNDEAIDSVVSLLADYPQNSMALALYFGLLTDKGDAIDAVNRTKAALVTTPENLKLRLTLARMQFQQQDFSGTLDTLNPVVLQDRLPLVFWQIKGQALLRSNKLSDATEHYEQWLNTVPYSKDAVLGVLLTKDLNSDYESALAVAESYVSKRSDLQIDILRAYFNALLHNQTETRNILATLPKEAHALAFVRGVKAKLALLDNRFADALDDARAAYEGKPTIKNLLDYVSALDGTNNRDDSFVQVQQYITQNPTDPRAKLLLAERLIERDKSAAITQYEESLKTLPDNFLILNNLAYLYFEEGRFDDALPLAQRATELRPSSADAADTLAQIYVAQGELKKARELYDIVLLDEVGNDEIILHAIEVFMKMGDVDLAKRRVTDRKWLTAQAKQLATQQVENK